MAHSVPCGASSLVDKTACSVCWWARSWSVTSSCSLRPDGGFRYLISQVCRSVAAFVSRVLESRGMGRGTADTARGGGVVSRRGRASPAPGASPTWVGLLRSYLRFDRGTGIISQTISQREHNANAHTRREAMKHSLHSIGLADERGKMTKAVVLLVLLDGLIDRRLRSDFV